MPMPLLEPWCIRNSNRNAKSEYSFSVTRLPPPSLGHSRIPSFGTYPGPTPPRSIHPLSVFPSKSFTYSSLALAKGESADNRSKLSAGVKIRFEADICPSQEKIGFTQHMGKTRHCRDSSLEVYLPA